MKIIHLALATALSVSATFAFAQDYVTDDMMAGISMLEVSAGNAFKRYNIEGDPMALSLAQLSAIVSILDDPENNTGGNTYKGAIEGVISK